MFAAVNVTIMARVAARQFFRYIGIKHPIFQSGEDAPGRQPPTGGYSFQLKVKHP
ncbi:hypothetical protein [Methylomonas fluvii]|nr:hypothetical protein [Methylomonas fluvii]